MKISILGTGAYGLALSLMFNENTKNIKMWTKFEDEKTMLEKGKSDKFKNIIIPTNIQFSTNLEEVITYGDIVVIAVPAAFVSSVMAEAKKFLSKEQHILIATKGIEQDTCLFISDVVSKYFVTDKMAVISGPSFAVDIASFHPIGLSLASTNKETIQKVKEALQNKYLKLRETDDLIGLEICGSIKNVVAIAAGILSGCGYSSSTQAMFITESLNDIKNLIKALGGDKKTILSFGGFGDLLLTSTSKKSRNYTFGYLIGSGALKEELEEYKNKTTIEGLYTLKSIRKLLKDKEVSMPIIDLIHDIVYNNKPSKILAKFLIEKK